MRHLKKTIIIILLCLSFEGCGTKKKLSDRSNTKIERTEQKNVSEIIESTSTVDSIVKSKTATITTKNNESIEIESANDSTLVDIKKKTEGSITEWKVRGAKSFKIVQEKEKESVLDTTSVNIKKTKEAKSELTEESDIDESFKNDRRTTDSESKRLGTWIYVFIFIGFLLLIFLLVRRKSKRLGKFSSWL